MLCARSLVVSWLLAALLPWRPSAANQCTIRYSNCAYELKLVGLGCSAPRNGLSAMADMMQRDEATRPENLSSAPYVSMKQLKDVEKRLLNVVEELSVRTLRHMRHIRNNLRTMNYMIGAEGAGRGGAGACPAEFLGIGSWPACYRFSAFSATWQEAKEYCNAFGADLVAVDSIKESYIVDYLIKSKLEHLAPKGWWTAGRFQPQKGQWMWALQSGLAAVTTSHWALAQPGSGAHMHCMMAYRQAAYRWHDADCTDMHNFICEIARHRRKAYF